jgi:hypothetical protein
MNRCPAVSTLRSGRRFQVGWDGVSWLSRWILIRGEEAVLPEADERLPINAVGGLERVEVELSIRFGFRSESDTWEVKAAQEFNAQDPLGQQGG